MQEGNRMYNFSRRLTKLLRHQAVQRGLAISPDGFAAVQDILMLPENSGGNGFTVNDVITVVQNDPKRRFSLCWRDLHQGYANDEPVEIYSASTEKQPPQIDAERRKGERCPLQPSLSGNATLRCEGADSEAAQGIAGVSTTADARFEGGCVRQGSVLRPPRNAEAILCIRANQGHSMACVVSEKLLRPIDSLLVLRVSFRHRGAAGFGPKVVNVVHGTYKDRWAKIQVAGLSRMSRNHIHFACYCPEGEKGVISGVRPTADLLIFLDVEKALEGGLKLFVSSNGVILSPGNEHGFIETRFFSKVTERATGNVIFRGHD